MSRKKGMVIWVAAGAVVVAAAIPIESWRRARRPIVLTGAVVRADPDPRKQSPVSNATVTALGSAPVETTKSDAAGLFRIMINPGFLGSRRITLRLEHADYQPLEIQSTLQDRLYVVRLEPVKSDPVVSRSQTPDKLVKIKNLRVRYSLKTQTTINVGSVAKQFEVGNIGNVPCKGQHPCSPDGKWKASTSTLALDADKGNEFRNVRVSCIAGPCPFTRLQSSDFSQPARKIQITALDWSDTASFLVEAEVTRTMDSDKVLQSYPFKNGQTMSFALPLGAEGPSIVADLDAHEIVFPLGPKLILSWATCTVEAAPGKNKIYRCELKPGYEFQQ
jgi:hypothetical protein